MTDEVFRLIPLRDAGRDRAGCGGAVVERELQELLCTLDRLAGNDLCGAQLNLCKVFNIDLGKTLNFLLRLFLRSVLRFHSGNLLAHLLRIDTGEENLRLVCYLTPIRVNAERIERIVCAQGRAKLCDDLLCGVRHKRCEERRADRDAFHKIIENGGKSVGFRFVLCKRPRHRFVNVLIAALEEREDFGNGICHAQLIHLRLHSVLCGEHNAL